MNIKFNCKILPLLDFVLVNQILPGCKKNSVQIKKKEKERRKTNNMKPTSIFPFKLWNVDKVEIELMHVCARMMDRISYSENEQLNINCGQCTGIQKCTFIFTPTKKLSFIGSNFMCIQLQSGIWKTLLIFWSMQICWHFNIKKPYKNTH